MGNEVSERHPMLEALRGVRRGAKIRQEDLVIKEVPGVDKGLSLRTINRIEQKGADPKLESLVKYVDQLGYRLVAVPIDGSADEVLG